MTFKKAHILDFSDIKYSAFKAVDQSISLNKLNIALNPVSVSSPNHNESEF
jgi:hypothetical protein